MVFHKDKIKINISIIFLNEPLISVKSAKILGVILEQSLTWIDHIQYVQNKIAKCLAIMCKAKASVNYL